MLFAIGIIVMVILDQTTKYWAVKYLTGVDTIPIINNIFHLTYVENRGAAFSMLQNKRLFFLIITVIVLGFIMYALKNKLVTTRTGRLSLFLICGGAIGNLIDRMFRGFVVDMFDFRMIRFPVFNVADVFVTLGGILLVYYLMFQYDKKDSNHE